jgi:hypothetical protein
MNVHVVRPVRFEMVRTPEDQYQIVLLTEHIWWWGLWRRTREQVLYESFDAVKAARILAFMAEDLKAKIQTRPG